MLPDIDLIAHLYFPRRTELVYKTGYVILNGHIEDCVEYEFYSNMIITTRSDKSTGRKIWQRKVDMNTFRIISKKYYCKKSNKLIKNVRWYKNGNMQLYDFTKDDKRFITNWYENGNIKSDEYTYKSNSVKIEYFGHPHGVVRCKKSTFHENIKLIKKDGIDGHLIDAIIIPRCVIL